jgi:hypothetical protein
MTDDLVKRLRKNVMCGDAVIEEAADRIEKLEAALREIKTLFANEDAWSVPHSIARKALEGKDD